MLLTLSAKSVWSDGRKGSSLPSRDDLPRWAREELGVHGLTLQTSLFAGWEIDQFDRFRDLADKAAAPCLVLVEDQSLLIADPDESAAAAAIERADRVLRVANRLGCSSVAISIPDTVRGADLEIATPRLRAILQRAERLELNLLISPCKGLTETPEKLTTLIRKVGGFRIGLYPDFEAAAASPDPIAYLRSLTPYASAVCASFQAVGPGGKARGYDIPAFIGAIRSVGYEAALTLEFRGKGNPVPHLMAAKEAIESCLSDDKAAAAAAPDDDEEADE